MSNKFNILDSDISYAIQEGKVTDNAFLIRVSIQSWQSREIEAYPVCGDKAMVSIACVPDTEYIWVKVTEEKFKELNFANYGGGEQ